MKYALMILPFLASTAGAQDDIWKLLQKGDRVSITFRSGNAIAGQLASKPADPRTPPAAEDYSTATQITLDVSLEYPGLNGTLTIPKKEIKDIRKLQSMDAATEKRIREEIARIQKQTAADEASRQSFEAERQKAAMKAKAAEEKASQASADAKNKGQAAVKDLEDLQKGLDLLKRFPPDKFGPQTAKEVADKSLLKIPVTPDEREFLDPETQRLWNKARDYQNSQDKEKKGDGK
jgi:hypothetical protein